MNALLRSRNSGSKVAIRKKNVIHEALTHYIINFEIHWRTHRPNKIL